MQKPVCLFINTKNWKSPKYPLSGKWINKLWCINTMEYYSAAKGNKLLTQLTTWMNLHNNVLGEMIPFISYSGKGKTQRHRTDQGLNGVEKIWLQEAAQEFRGDETVCILTMGVVTRICTCITAHGTTYPKEVTFTVCKFKN